MRLTLSDEDVRDILVTAAEGGINYWATISARLDERLIVFDRHDPEAEWYEVDAAVIRRGFAKMLEVGYVLFEPCEPGAMDAGEADAVVQLGVFGELIYS